MTNRISKVDDNVSLVFEEKVRRTSRPIPGDNRRRSCAEDQDQSSVSGKDAVSISKEAIARQDNDANVPTRSIRKSTPIYEWPDEDHIDIKA